MRDVIPFIDVENYEEIYNFVNKYRPNKIILSCDTRPKDFVSISERIKEEYPNMKLGNNAINDESILFYIPNDLPDFIYSINYEKIPFTNYTGEYFCRMYINSFNKNITELLEQVKRNINYLSIIPLKNNNTIDYEQLKILENNNDIYCELFSLKHYKVFEECKINKYIINFNYNREEVEELYKIYFF